jgi:hypothetical protein
MLPLGLPQTPGFGQPGYAVVEPGSSVHRELSELRRDLHAHPELGCQEVRTSELVAGKLRAWGLEVAEGVGGTGAVGTLRGSRPGGRALGLRADMDGLSITEQSGLPYASRVPGVMHACGHDGHTAVLLGAARHLASLGVRVFGLQPAQLWQSGADPGDVDRVGSKASLEPAHPARRLSGCCAAVVIGVEYGIRGVEQLVDSKPDRLDPAHVGLHRRPRPLRPRCCWRRLARATRKRRPAQSGQQQQSGARDQYP